MSPSWGHRPLEGLYKAAAIGDDERSEFHISIVDKADQTLSFDFKVDSEGNFDFFEVEVSKDGRQWKWSGQLPWQTLDIPIESNDETITFRYRKDLTVSVGDDTVYLKNIRLDGQPIRSATLQGPVTQGPDTRTLAAAGALPVAILTLWMLLMMPCIRLNKAN